MIRFVLACFAQINLNGQVIPCAPEIEYRNVEREIRIGARRVKGARPFGWPGLRNYPGLVVVTGAELLFADGLEKPND